MEKNKKNRKESEMIKNFTNTCRTMSTKRMYRRSVEIFLYHIYDHDQDKDPEFLVKKYLKAKRNHRNDLISFINYLEEQNYSPKTVNLYLVGVKEFLFYYNIEFTQSDLKVIKRRKPKSVNINRDLPVTPEILHTIIDHFNGIQGKALTLFLASSGCRINEALSITIKDIDLSQNPPRIYLRGLITKNQCNRTTFISNEAKEALGKWLDLRESYIEKKVKNYKHLKINPVNDHVFPYNERTAHSLWNTALKRSGLDKEKDHGTGRFLYTFHGLRRFFKSQLTGHLESEIVERLLGHEGYLNGSYFRISENEMAEKYLEVENRLETKSLLKNASRVKELETRVDILQSRNDGLENIVNSLKNQNNDLMKMFIEFKEFHGIPDNPIIIGKKSD